MSTKNNTATNLISRVRGKMYANDRKAKVSFLTTFFALIQLSILKLIGNVFLDSVF